ncbi:MAG: GIY-YIG nuclease family protein [Lewinellaceae bacterium]|nr:GIY-YIG nuclease family protein [Lewinella sp.]MCB9281784.1 GIY-YIG nuclease family protein [Lewinellaceae bacterium]
MYYAYILKSTKTGRYYYGSTADLAKRLTNHNAGRVRSTKAYKPWEIHYFEEYPTKSEAFNRERFFKTIEGYQFLKMSGII